MITDRQSKILFMTFVGLLFVALWYGHAKPSHPETVYATESPKDRFVIPSLENYSKVKESYLRDGNLYVEVTSGTSPQVQSLIANEAGRFFLSTHKETEFLHVYVMLGGSYSMAALYDGASAGKER
jgi:hypothetical protein